ncbi:MAG TPA: four helix bundle protein [Saprospiraceae bacterium]|jgi:four helix bundle protein|nr:four helix bundle protein [Saprospiraceae bacterium]HMT71913.1 four helix bundle protein [Saprospiraceae bacterium]
MKEFSFEKLDVWKDAKDFVVKIYQLTEVYPNDEKFGLISQIRTASLSVTNNISEGTSRWSSKEKIRFIEIAFSSLMEVLNCLIISKELNLIDEKIFLELRLDIGKISNKLNSLASYFKKLNT